MIERIRPIPEGPLGDAKRHSGTRLRTLRSRTAEDLANEETAEQLALRIFAAIVADKVLSGMATLFDELIQKKYLPDDGDDEEQAGDESWLDMKWATTHSA
jgi:hypothetical protein